MDGVWLEDGRGVPGLLLLCLTCACAVTEFLPPLIVDIPRFVYHCNVGIPSLLCLSRPLSPLLPTLSPLSALSSFLFLLESVTNNTAVDLPHLLWW